MMNSRERVLTTLKHKEPDHVPFDLGGTGNTGIHKIAYRNLLSHLRIEKEEIRTSILTEQLAEIDEEVLQKLNVDVRGIYPNSPSSWDLEIKEESRYRSYMDEFGVKLSMPKEKGLYYDIAESPLSGAITVEDIENYSWPDLQDPSRIEGIREKIQQLSEEIDTAIVLNTFYVGILESGEWLRGFKDFFIDLASNSPLVESLLDIVTDMRMKYWEMVLDEVGDLADVVVELDDVGMQDRLLISPETYRKFIKPRHKRLFSFIKRKAPNIHIQLHSCGSVYDLIPDFIEVGVEILNPVQVSAAKMDTKRLKREFGDELTFWGGGVDTQKVLPYGTPEEVREEVKRRINDLAAGGGFIFSTVHNIQADVPPENIMAMWEALQEYGKY